MHVLIAPDKFRGTLTAAQAARAIETGWLRVRPGDSTDLVAMADGGEGTLDALVDGLGGQRHRVRVTGPLGDPVDAEYATVPSPDGLQAVVEMARASGLALLAGRRRDPLRATTRGTGELIATAMEIHNPARVIVCIGGSATNDGGAGMAQGLGARLLDPGGKDVGPGGAALLDLASVDARPVAVRTRGTEFLIACDVDNPLVGPKGAAAVYGPQKGATPDDLILLDRALGHYAAVLHRDLGIDVREIPGAGAAGGLGAGLIAFLGARLRPGVEVVIEAVGFRERLERADVVITGEGKLDEQSMHGKTVAGVLAAARDRSRPPRVAALCGRAEVRPDGLEVIALAERFGMDRAMNETRPALADLAAELAGSFSEP